jgi:signal transduction histidine kinase/response regulator of citrate/malate metabolism
MIRVLYAEDDPQVAEMVQLHFGYYGTDCVLDLVNSGRHCLELMQSGGYDVLLLDLIMPDLDGLRVLGELIARRDATPVIMVSGQGQHELTVRALRAGAVDCIDKNSADFRRIPEIVRRVYARHQRGRTDAPLPAPPAAHPVLFVDPEPAECAKALEFFEANAPRLRLTAEPLQALDAFVRGETSFDAVVLGPNIDSGAMLDALRHLRARENAVPVVVISTLDHGETTIAAFRLGAHDYLLRSPGCFNELVFSLHNALKHADTERLNARLTSELALLNRSLAEQITARTQQLEREVNVRREAEHRAEDNAARLQALSNRLLRVQEDERHALARELHDQIGQLLTGLRFQLDSARTTGSPEPVEQAILVTDELLRSVRALTLQLRPRLLDDLGLKPALEWHANVFHNQTGIAIELELSLPPGRLASELETAVFRMVQEALTNVARHSGATAAAVTVTADESALQVEVSDRGRGFDVAKAFARHDSLGLTGLSERVRLAGGRFELFSQPGQGTRLHAEFSLHPPAASS